VLRKERRRHCLLTNSLDSNSKSIDAHELTFGSFGDHLMAVA